MAHVDPSPERVYDHIALQRAEGVVRLTLHSERESLRWGAAIHHELGDCLAAIDTDPANEVVIITGTGDAFCDTFETTARAPMSPEAWAASARREEDLLGHLLGLRIPTIAAVNGPATIHADIAVLCDIVLASKCATFQDRPHFGSGFVPGDGAHVIWPALLGPNRGRYFLMTGEVIDAEEARRLGVVAEVHPPDVLLARAHELAVELLRQPPLTRQYTKALLAKNWRSRMVADLGYGLASEGLAAMAHWPTSADGG